MIDQSMAQIAACIAIMIGVSIGWILAILFMNNRKQFDFQKRVELEERLTRSTKNYALNIKMLYKRQNAQLLESCKMVKRNYDRIIAGQHDDHPHANFMSDDDHECYESVKDVLAKAEGKSQ